MQLPVSSAGTTRHQVLHCLYVLLSLQVKSSALTLSVSVRSGHAMLLRHYRCLLSYAQSCVAAAAGRVRVLLFLSGILQFLEMS